MPGKRLGCVQFWCCRVPEWEEVESEEEEGEEEVCSQEHRCVEDILLI